MPHSLSALEARRAELLRSIAHLNDMRPGSIVGAVWRCGKDEILLGDMAYLKTRCRLVAMMPQWDFLDFLAERARCYSTFHLRMQTEITSLIEDQDRVIGIRGNSPAGPAEIRADLIVGADGRNSVVRNCSGLIVKDVGAPMDVLWIRLSKRASDPDLITYAEQKRALALVDRETISNVVFQFLRRLRRKCKPEELRSSACASYNLLLSCATAWGS